MVAGGECVVDVVENCRIGYACKEFVSFTNIGLEGGIGVDVVLDKRQAAVVDILAYGRHVITEVGFQHAAV